MDILALPDVFLRAMTRKVTLKDRLRIRATCRVFESLVADTHAGYFGKGSVNGGAATECATLDHNWERLCVFPHIGDLKFLSSSTFFDENDCENVIHLRNRLFSGISIGEFSFGLGKGTIFLGLWRKLTRNFTIRLIRFHVESSLAFEQCLQLMTDFPSSKYRLKIVFPLSIWASFETQMQCLPRLEVLEMGFDLVGNARTLRTLMSSLHSENSGKIPAVMFFQLLATQTNLILEKVVLSPGDFVTAAEIISSDSRELNVKLVQSVSICAKWLTYCGFSSLSKNGDRYGQFEVMSYEILSDNFIDMEISHERCIIKISKFIWDEISCFKASVVMTNFRDTMK
ncbi:hypothetical protein PRIPAC_84759 [Pristionchus pacificus]|nr:hypothetical protein PRIPAC_84759 [Pristionchus pacificus]